jgi:dinuclear metal center YbgI/SA1388 family protein
MPCPLSQIIAELDRLLEPERFHDFGPNGLQVPGRSEVSTVATGVSASVELFELARAKGADLLVVHHGLFWGPGPGPIDAALKRRLQILFDADMSLAAYHLPLDAHPLIGNNAMLGYGLGALTLEPFAEHHGEPIGSIASFGEAGVEANELFARVQALTDRAPLVFDFGPEVIRRLAIVSGGGSGYLAEAASAGAHAFLTGEPTERAMAQAKEASIHYVAAGHYATETFGVQRLGEHLSERLGVEHLFLEIPNPV